ncbi:hypothetical protein Tco_0872581 [Tanacetum coccineum]
MQTFISMTSEPGLTEGIRDSHVKHLLVRRYTATTIFKYASWDAQGESSSAGHRSYVSAHPLSTAGTNAGAQSQAHGAACQRSKLTLTFVFRVYLSFYDAVTFSQQQFQKMFRLTGHHQHVKLAPPPIASTKREPPMFFPASTRCQRTSNRNVRSQKTNIKGRYDVSVPALTKDHRGIKPNMPYPEDQYAVLEIRNEYNILEDIKHGPYSKKPLIRRIQYLDTPYRTDF